eukprot:scaffold67958_cov58-Cyclotella_meneghiniana.AAC.1
MSKSALLWFTNHENKVQVFCNADLFSKRRRRQAQCTMHNAKAKDIICLQKYEHEKLVGITRKVSEESQISEQPRI